MYGEFQDFLKKELAAIEELAKSLVRFVHDRIAREEFESEDDVLRYVLVRDADIVSEAAWIDARFPIALISKRIRRAGLDLNPDWLPCIGTVMRFTYE